MIRTFISLVVFLAGLAVIAWTGFGYLSSNPLALAIIGLIAIAYLTGVIELQRYQNATNTLTRSVRSLDAAPTNLDSWLEQLAPNLRGATRLRIEGQRIPLPGPALAPYLVGLLVLLGMLGTFLGMVATLRGTGLALENAVDIQAIRASLAAPVEGLGFAFGTSVAGVAASAALGLLATIARRSRIQSVQQLDTVLATTLRPYSQRYHHEQTHQLMQQQAQAMPLLVDRLEAMMAAIETQTHALHERLSTTQDAFYHRTEHAYNALATSVEQTLKQSIANSAVIAGEAIQPAVERTLAGLARETSAWQDTLALSVRHQLDTLSDRFSTTTTSVTDIWNQALVQQQHTNSKLAEDNQRALTTTTEQFSHHASSLLERMDQSHATLQNTLAAQDDQRLQTWATALNHLATSLRTTMEGTAENVHASMVNTANTIQTSLQGMTQSLDLSLKDTVGNLREEWQQASAHATEQQRSVCDTLEKTAHQLTLQTQSHARDTITEISQLLRTVSEAPTVAAQLMSELRQSHADLQSTLIAQDQQRLNDWKATLDHIASNWNGSLQSTAATLREEWAHTTEQTAAHQRTICDTLATTAQTLTEQTQTHARDTIAEVSQLLHTVSEAPKIAAEVITGLHQSHVELQAQLIAQDQQRLNDWKASLDHIASHWNDSLQSTAATLREEWTHTTEQTAAHQRTICDTLATTAQTLTEQTQTHARDTIAEVSQLLHTVSEAPKIAAEVITGLHQSHVDLQAQLIAQDQQRLNDWKASLDHIASQWNDSLQTTSGTLRSVMQDTSTALTSSLTDTAATLNTTFSQTAETLSAQTQAQARETIAEVSQLLATVSEAPKAAIEVIAGLQQSHADLQAKLIAQDEQRLDTWKSSLTDIASTWNTSLEKTASTLNASMEDTAASLSASLTGTTSTLTVTLENTASTLHNALDDITSSINVSMENTAYTLRQEWEQASAHAAQQQQGICDTLSKTAQDIVTHTQTQAHETIAEVAQLVQTAAEAPRAAAAVISELRQKLSDGIARDNELLEERGRLMETLGTLLDAVNHASTQQRDVVDTLITNSTALLERVGSHFTQSIQSETDKLAGAAAHITTSAVEVASLGEAFGTSVHLFNQSNDKLVEHLQRVEAALSKSMTRSDEQLAYYVAQAREVVDLSILSQKQILTDLQKIADQQLPSSNDNPT